MSESFENNENYSYLGKKLDDLKMVLIEQNNLSREIETDSINDLISELDSIKDEWFASLNRLKEYENEYSDIMSELKNIKTTMNIIGFKIPLYKRILAKFKRNK